MSYDISRFGAAAQKQILKKLREAEAAKIAKQDAKKRPLGSAALTEKKGNKLHAERTEDGYDSKREAKRAAELRMMEKAGIIENLQEQVRFEIVPVTRMLEHGVIWRSWSGIPVYNAAEAALFHVKCGSKVIRPIKDQNIIMPKGSNLIERSAEYRADFLYFDENGDMVVEDAKGYKGGEAYKLFVLKRKLMMLVYGIRVREV